MMNPCPGVLVSLNREPDSFFAGWLTGVVGLSQPARCLSSLLGRWLHRTRGALRAHFDQPRSG